MPKRRPAFSTIRDVARLADVSVATVSGVINGKETVSAEIQRRVEEAMRVLDYHVNRTARSLKTGRSNIVGMVVPDISNPFFTDVMSGAEAIARRRGYSVILSNSNEDPEQERENLEILYSQRVGGVLIACTQAQTAYDRFASRRFPMVFIDRLPPAGFTGWAVKVDNAGAAYEATRHLIQLGHKRIAIIVGRLDVTVGIERLEGFRNAMRDAGLPIRDGYIQHGHFDTESGYRCATDLLRLAEPPTAIFACNNQMTLGLMHALADCGVPCPGRVSVFGFDDFPWAAYFQPHLTTVAQPVYEMGRHAMQMLLARMEPDSEEARDITERTIVLKAELRIRESTAAPPSNGQRAPRRRPGALARTT